MKAINFLQHNLTAEQSAELAEKFQVTEFISVPETIKGLLQNSPGTAEALSKASLDIWRFLRQNDNEVKIVIMPGGSPALNAHLWRIFGDRTQYDSTGMIALFAHSVRESVDQVQPDGSTKKVAVFRHCHFIEVAM